MLHLEFKRRGQISEGPWERKLVIYCSVRVLACVRAYMRACMLVCLRSGISTVSCHRLGSNCSITWSFSPGGGLRDHSF